MSIDAWKKAKHNAGEAEAYLGLIGKTTNQSTVASREGVGATAGQLTKFEIITQIHFQPYDGATNYHNCKAFDAALSEVVRKKWTTIRDEAMALLREKEAAAGAAAEASVEALLADIRSKQPARTEAPHDH